MANWQEKERVARNAIEGLGFVVHDANVLFGVNCPNIDLVVFGKTKAIYVQVKSSEVPASKDGVVVDGSPWTQAQLYENGPIFNRHGEAGYYEAGAVVIVDKRKNGAIEFYVAKPKALEDLLRTRGLAYAAVPKRDGAKRSIGFRKELSREELAPFRDAWKFLGVED